MDFFLARHYSAAEGRFITPDWASKPQAVPYAKFDNPQTLNLYTYVKNNPLRFTDPDGHSWLESLFKKDKKAAIAKMPLYDHKAPPPPPFALLITDIKHKTTTLYINTPTTAKAVQIETRVDPDSRSKPGAGGAFTTPNVNGVLNLTGEKAYGPKGAYIDTGDSRGRDIHGGGSGLKDPMADRQGWWPTRGCTRGQNEDVIKLGEEITNFKETYPEALIPYRRE